MTLKNEKNKQALHLVWYVLLWLHPTVQIFYVQPQVVKAWKVDLNNLHLFFLFT